MADTKISGLIPKTTIASTDLLVMVDNASTPATKNITARNFFSGKGPSLLVAATDSTTAIKLMADYLCDGSNDQVEINSAITALGSGGGTVTLAKGTYSITGTINITYTGTILEGQGWGTVLDVLNSTNDHVIEFTPPGSTLMSGVVIRDMKIKANGANQTAGETIYAYGATWCTFHKLWINKPWGSGIKLYQDNLGGYGHHNTVSDCFIDDGEVSNGGDGRAIYMDQSDENMIVNCTFQGNGRAAAGEPNHVFDKAGLNSVIGCQFVTGQTAIKFQGSHNKAIGNTFDGCQNHQMRLNGSKNIISGNTFYNIGFGSSSSDDDGLFIDNVSFNTVTGNFFIPYVTTPGCRSGISMSSGPATNNVVFGNTFSEQDGGVFGTARIVLSTGTGNTAANNYGCSTIEEAKTLRMKNTSGGDLAAGDIVTLKAVAAGNEVTVTTTQGDDLVFGVATEAITSTSFGNIQTLGKTTLLKVNGTTDIAVGDLIGTYTTAKIGMKASTGDCAFAIALEAYTSNDSSGVIDALLISPRLV